MGQIADLKASVAAEFRTSKDILQIAKDLNTLRLRFEQEGRATDADAVRQQILRLIDQADKIADVARANGQTLVDAIRDSW